MILHKKFYCLLSIVIIMLLGENKVKANEHKEFLTKMCHITFNSEMDIAGKTPPKGMMDFTCNCFIDKISSNFSVESARIKCKEDASLRFNL